MSWWPWNKQPKGDGPYRTPELPEPGLAIEYAMSERLRKAEALVEQAEQELVRCLVEGECVYIPDDIQEKVRKIKSAKDVLQALEEAISGIR